MKHSLFLLAVGLLCWTGAQAATINHAYDGSKTAAENGDALKTAISNASSGDEVRVQAGTYVGNFTMKEGVNVSGGWNAGFTEQTDYATVLDANASGRVVNQAAAFSTLTVWSNLTIQNGNVSGNGGGAWLLDKGQLKHCKIQNNQATGYGGGVGNDWTSPTETQRNYVLIDDCIVTGNKAKQGGGVRICATIQNSTVSSNSTIKIGETNAGAGAGIHLQGGRVYNCKVTNNTSNENTAGIRAYGACHVINCLIANNTAKGSTGSNGQIGGLSWENGGAGKIINNTIVNNEQTSSSNAARCGIRCATANESALLINNVVWGNKANGSLSSTQGQGLDNTIFTGTNAILNNAVYNATIGTSGIKLTADNPGFSDPSENDFSLVYSSSLRNKGNNANVVGTFDVSGLPRKVDGTVDIGAYECQWVEGNRTVKVGENLQNVIDHTFAGNSVKVQAGAFYGNFTMRENVQVSGGWNEDFTEQTDYATILDAQASGRVVNQPAAFSTLTVWSNLTIQNGKFTAQQTDRAGAGVYLCDKGQVKHCIIQNNLFDAASGEASGGGVYENGYTTSVLIDDCIIRGNTASHGGGVRICGVIQNSIIENNTTTINACGGVQLHYGGAMYNCIIRHNTGKDTGGVRLTGTKACTVANCLIAGNNATQTIGGMSLENGIHYVYNTTIVGNKQTSSDDASRCGVRLNVSANLEFANNIVWGNKVGETVQDVQMQFADGYSDKGAYFINNAIVYSSDFGTNTILLSESPFADANYHLLPTSDLINSGNDTKSAGTTDLAGKPRKQGTIDRGCYEQTKYSREVTEGRMGTICLPYAVPSGAIAGAQVYKVISFATEEKAGLLLEEVNTMAAGKPYFFMPNADEVTFAYIAEGDAAEAGNKNGLYGTIEGKTVSGEGYYVLQNNLLCPTYNAATSEAIEITLAANRAYLKFDEVPAAGGAAPAPGRRVLGIQQAQNTPTAISNQQSAAGVQKVLRDGQLLIIRDGRTYNVLGL